MSKTIEWLNHFTAIDLTEGTRSVLKIPPHAQTDLDCHSMVNFEFIIDRMLDIIPPRSITEIGIEKPAFSRYLAHAASRLNANLIVFAPHYPKKFMEHVRGQNPDLPVDFREKAALGNLTPAEASDMFVISRAHNYRAVFSDLHLIDSVKPMDEPLVVLLHNVGWPYGRRDFFLNSDDISGRQDLVEGELSPFDERPSRFGFSWNNRRFSEMEGGPKNGVLTALEDFLQCSNRNWGRLFTPLFYGLAVLWDRDSLTERQGNAMEALTTKIEFANEISSISELNRIMLLIRLQQAGKTWARLKARNAELEEKNVRLVRKKGDLAGKAPATDDPMAMFLASPPTVDYLVNMSPKLGCLYMETPKVACSTIKKTLQLMEVNGDSNQLVKDVHDKRNSPLLSPKDDLEFFRKALSSEDVIRFSFVRNPYTRILSCFLDKFVTNEWERRRRLPVLGFEPTAKISLLDFLNVIRTQEFSEMDIHWMPQSFILSKSKIDYTYIGRFETFDMDFARVLAAINGEKYIKIENHSAHATHAESKVEQYLGEAEKRIILDIYEEDFDAFLYSKNEKMI